MQSSLNSINSENSVQRGASPISDDIFYKENAYFFLFGYFVANLRIFYRPKKCDGVPKWTNSRYTFDLSLCTAVETKL